ncbi:Syntenin-2 [Galemys pyrenaicus]|uniref:Syntenin-2 n=1 Tax=Galemys pyrenaicus TaxID=202257 RepID=A0A8J6DXF2_GALPY|nr:Syntenin-2 [Galemys pyrenaicus]
MGASEIPGAHNGLRGAQTSLLPALRGQSTGLIRRPGEEAAFAISQPQGTPEQRSQRAGEERETHALWAPPRASAPSEVSAQAPWPLATGPAARAGLGVASAGAWESFPDLSVASGWETEAGEQAPGTVAAFSGAPVESVPRYSQLTKWKISRGGAWEGDLLLCDEGGTGGMKSVRSEGMVSQGAAMSVLYPSLEDLKVDHAIQLSQAGELGTAPSDTFLPPSSLPLVLYPNLAELENYMGLSLSSDEVQQNLPGILEGASTVVSSTSVGLVVAPVSGNNLGVRRAEIKPGVREIHLCKDERGKIGLRLRAIDQGIFVQLVQANTPASLVGLRFGDQILQIDGRDCAGWSTDKAHRALKKASAERITMVVRDRPFQRTLTLHKDSTGHVGFVIKKGKVVSVVKGSSAARNGLLTNHYLCEVNGQNVIGLKDKDVIGILATGGNVITLTVIPSVIYEHMVKK